jgi:hypothetical protein
MLRMPQASWWSRIWLCLLAGAVGTVTLLRLGRRFAAPWLGPAGLTLVAVAAGIFLMLAVGYPVVWARRQRRPGHNETQTVAFWQGIIYYCLAIDLATFGWQKIYHLQFFVPLGMLDLPFSSLSGEELTWAYFRHSYPYIVAIGACQIGGSLLLLFRRTRLLGAIVLVPVLVNIILLDYFYGLDIGVLVHALVLAVGLAYLISLDYRRLVVFFLREASQLPRLALPHRWPRQLLRWAAVGGPLLLAVTYPSPDTYPQLTGKYAVHDLRLRHQPVPAPSCQDSVLTVVYLDIAHDCVFECNGTQRRRFGTYSYDGRTRQLQVVWRYPTPSPDTLWATLAAPAAGNGLAVAGHLGRLPISFTLQKIQ